MLVVSIVIGVGMLCVMVYFALSKKSRFWVRVAALVALGVMIAAVITGLIVILLGRVSVAGDSIFVDMDLPPAPPPAGNSLLIFILLFLVALFVTVLVLSLREHRNKKL